MPMLRRSLLAISLAPLTMVLLLFTSGTANAVPNVAQKCAIAKINAAKAKFACLAAQSNKVVLGKTPNTAACANAFMKAFARAEAAAAKHGGSCQVTGDAAAVEQRVDTEEGSTAQLLAGGFCTEAGESGFQGVVNGIGAPDLTVGGKTIVTDSQTLIGGVGSPASLGDIQQGDLLAVCGTLQADGSFLAIGITRLPPAM
jgi:hypothetical protein